MNLVRFNYPSLLSRLANDALFGNNYDSTTGNFNDCGCESAIQYYVTERDDSYLLQMVLPGYTKSDVNIEIDNEWLTIKSKPEENKETVGFIKAPFEKRFKLSEKINTDSISATAENGILNINLPKVPQAVKKPARAIDIQ